MSADDIKISQYAMKVISVQGAPQQDTFLKQASDGTVGMERGIKNALIFKDREVQDFLEKFAVIAPHIKIHQFPIK